MQTNPDQTLYQWLEVHAQYRPDAPALISTEHVITYGELDDKVRKLATGLADIGIGRGDVVAAQLPNCPEFIIAFLATAARGAIFQTLHMPYRSHELSHLLGHGNAKVVVALNTFKDINPVQEILGLLPDLATLETVISVGQSTKGALSFADLTSVKADPAAINDTQPDDNYLLLYTSGTTASPKGVPHSYRGFLGNSWEISRQLQFGGDDRILSLAPFSHLYGLMIVHMALATGSANVLIPAFNPPTLVADLKTHKPTAIFAAPAHFAPFIAKGGMAPEMFEQTRLVCLSGSTVAPKLARNVDELLPRGKVIQLWGMSELQAGAYGRPKDTLASRTETTGKASPGAKLRVVDGGGVQQGPETEGALEIRGPSVFAGYLNNPQETDNSFTNDGWFKTGDLAIIAADGDLRLTGRTKEIINRGGVKYNPVDVELLLAEMPQIQACTIVPLPDKTLGEKACLCVELQADQTLELADVVAFLNDRKIAKYKLPERLEIFTTLPLTPTRKVMRGQLISSLTQNKG